MARLNSIFSGGSKSPKSDNSKGLTKYQKDRKNRYGDGILDFDRLYESLSMDGTINQKDRDKLSSALERLVARGSIKSGSAKTLYNQYGLGFGLKKGR